MSLCSTAIPPVDFDFSVDIITCKNEFSDFDSGFSLNDFLTSSNLPSSDGMVIKFDAELLQNLELSSSPKSESATTINASAKRKWNEFGDDEFVCFSQSKKQCHESNKPLMAPYNLSSFNFDVDIPIEYLLNLVGEFLNAIEFGVFDYDSTRFTWTVTIMGANNFCCGKIQIYESHQFGQCGYIVEADLIDGDQDLFRVMFDNLSEHVQTTSFFRYSFTSDDEFNVSPQSIEIPSKEKISSICNSMLKASTTRSEEDENCLFENVTFLCSTFDAISNSSSMKSIPLDISYLLRTLVRTSEVLSDTEDISAISTLAKWALVYSVRCILLLANLDSRCLTELKSPGYKKFRTWLAQQQQDMQLSVMESFHEFRLFDTLVQMLLSSLSSAVSSSTLKDPLCEIASPQFKRNINSASSLLAVENCYRCTEEVSSVPGIFCSG